MAGHIPCVSIGMPVYNGEDFLKEALDSLLSQTFQDFELIISDNASTDGTEEICRSYAAGDRRIRYYRNIQNCGAAWNFNRVFKLSTADYFKWATHDDVCAPAYIERCVDVLDRIPSVVLCYPKTIIIDGASRPIKQYDDGFDLRFSRPHERFRAFFFTGGLINAIHGLIRTRALRKTRLWSAHLSADQILLAELALVGKFYEVQEYLFYRRDHPNASGRANPTVNAYAFWLNPSNRTKIHLPTCRLLLEYLKALNRAEIGYFEKALCYAYMIKVFRWSLKHLKPELILAGQQLLRGF